MMVVAVVDGHPPVNVGCSEREWVRIAAWTACNRLIGAVTSLPGSADAIPSARATLPGKSLVSLPTLSALSGSSLFNFDIE